MQRKFNTLIISTRQCTRTYPAGHDHVLRPGSRGFDTEGLPWGICELEPEIYQFYIWVWLN